MTNALNNKLPLEMFYRWEKERPSNVYLRQPKDGNTYDYTWDQVGDQVRRMAAYIKSLGYPSGSSIALLSKNCAHWIMTDLAIWMSGNVSVPLYPTLTSKTINQILVHSEAKMLFVGKLDGWKEMKPGVPEDLPCIGFPYGTADEYTSWDQIMEKYEPLKESPTRTHDDIATIIYTSGTTGMPKGVVHKFTAFAFSGTNAMEMVDVGDNERFFSYLPLSHVAERILVETISLYCGGMISFAESLDTFAENLRDTQPTVFLAVPRIWTKFQMGILEKMPQKKLDLFLKIPILKGIVKKKLQKALGLDKANAMYTGAAPISASLMQWYRKLGIEILNAYSQTENLAYSHLTRSENNQFGFVGQPMIDVDVKISEEGEVLVKSHCNMVGYFKEPEKTKEVFTEDGYIKTGDQGEINSEGFLKLTGRVKDLFKTSKGKYVAPSPIELKLSKNSHIEQVCVTGVGLPQPVALVVLSEAGQAEPKDVISKEFAALLKEINPTLDHHENLQKVIIMKEEWTVENNIMTPTLKIKRNVIDQAFEGNLENWYNSKDTVIFQ